MALRNVLRRVRINVRITEEGRDAYLQLAKDREMREASLYRLALQEFLTRAGVELNDDL